VAGDVHDFADEVEAGDSATFHGMRGEGVGRDAARGDFRFLEAFGTGGGDGPVVELVFELVEGVVGPVGGGGQVEEAVGEAGWKFRSERGPGCGEVAAGGCGAERGEEVVVRGPVDVDWFALGAGGGPVGGDLEDGGAAEAAMGEEEFFAEAALADGGDDFSGDSGEVGERVLVRAAEGEGDEGGAGFADRDVELAGDVVAEAGGAHFGDGESAGGDDYVGGRVSGGVGLDQETRLIGAGVGGGFGIAADFLDFGFEDDFDVRLGGFGEEHSDDLFCGVVAEELAQGFLVVPDAVAFDEGDEVGGGVACERGFGEVGVGGEEVVGVGVEVGEIAAASAGDEDFFADAAGVFEEGDAASAFAGFDGAEEAGGTCSEDENFGGWVSWGLGHGRRCAWFIRAFALVCSELPDAGVRHGSPMRRSYMRVVCVRAILGILFSASFFPAYGSGPGLAHGLWVWKSPGILGAPQGAESLRDFCKAQGVNEVYVSVSASSEASEEPLLVKLIGLLHGSNIRVEALFSSMEADEAGKHRDTLLSHVQGIVEFNQKHSADRFDGIHLDVEPWQRAENKGAGNLQFLSGLVDAYRAVVAIATPAGMTVNADIQSKLLKGNASQRQMLLSSVPRLTLMMYELTNPRDGKSAEEKAAQVATSSHKYLDIAYDGLSGSQLTKMAIALRTTDYGNLLSQMFTELDSANQANPHYLGWAWQSYGDTLPATQ
jgi:hypothetical protein